MPTRRAFLATTLGGLTAVAGCSSRGNASIDSDGPPVTEPSVPLAYDRSDVYDAAVVGESDPDDPPSVGNFDSAIDEPQFVGAAAADAFLDPGSVVFGIEIDGDARAYPQAILVWHEFANDSVGGVNVSVTYCPLTGSALAFERGGTSFGISNKLVNSNLIMYDRETETWWPQILGEGIAGDHRGAALIERRLTWTSWERWRSVHPDTQVLSEETGYARDYDDDPYGAYDPPSGYYAEGPPARPVMYEDERLHAKTVVIGARGAGGALAVEKERLRRERVVTIEAAHTTYTGFYDDVLDTGYIYENPDRRSFEAEDGLFVDDDGKTWNAAEIPLSSVNAFDVMWFAWVVFYPNTALS